MPEKIENQPVAVFGGLGLLLSWVITTYLVPELPDELRDVLSTTIAEFLTYVVIGGGGLFMAYKRAWGPVSHRKAVAESVAEAVNHERARPQPTPDQMVDAE